jgi:hypothetical protein
MSPDIIVTNTTCSGIEIEDLHYFMIPVSGTETLTDYFSAVEIAGSNHLVSLVATGDLTVNNGVEDLTSSNGIKYCLGQFNEVNLFQENRDRSGKLRVHQTSRKLGLRIAWTGVGDDASDVTRIFSGEPLTFEFTAVSGVQGEIMSKYIDFNIVENETWLHEGYLTWKNCHFEKLTLRMVPRVTSVTASSGTNYNLYGGYLVIPAYPGTGTIDIISDITDPIGGLVYMPNDDLGNSPVAYWNADWNSTTKKYENISAAPDGDGRYNMFGVEVPFVEFISEIPLLESGFIALNSSDTDQMGQGMRLKMFLKPGIHDTAVKVGIACILCVHREKST